MYNPLTFKIQHRYSGRSNWWTQVCLGSMWVQGGLTWIQLDQVGLRCRLHLGGTEADPSSLPRTPRGSNAAPTESVGLSKYISGGLHSTSPPKWKSTAEYSGGARGLDSFVVLLRTPPTTMDSAADNMYI